MYYGKGPGGFSQKITRTRRSSQWLVNQKILLQEGSERESGWRSDPLPRAVGSLQLPVGPQHGAEWDRVRFPVLRSLALLKAEISA